MKVAPIQMFDRVSVTIDGHEFIGPFEMYGGCLVSLPKDFTQFVDGEFQPIETTAAEHFTMEAAEWTHRGRCYARFWD
jgi:hypothetical protein